MSESLCEFFRRAVHQRWEVITPTGSHFQLCFTEGGANRVAARRNEIAARRNRRHRTGRTETYTVRAVWM